MNDKTNPFSPCLNITCPHPDTCTANGKCLAKVVEPVRYEVQFQSDPWTAIKEHPLAWIKPIQINPDASAACHDNFLFRRTDDGSLWRVEVEKRLKSGDVLREGDEFCYDPHQGEQWKPVEARYLVAPFNPLRLNFCSGNYRRPAHLVRVTTPASARCHVCHATVPLD